MNKLLMKVAGIALGLSLATGIGVAVTNGSEESTPVEASTNSGTAPTNATYSHVFSSGELKVTATGTASLSNITWNTTCANTSAYIGYDATKGIQLGSGTAGKTIQNGYTISTAVSNFGSNKKVTKMAIGMSNASSGGYSGTFANSDTWSGTATSVTYYTSTAMSITSGDITFSFQSTKQKAVYIKAIYVWYEDASSTPKIEFSESSISGEEGEEFSFTWTESNLSSAISWSPASASTDIIDYTVNTGTKTVSGTLKKAGTVTLTGTSGTASDSVTFTVAEHHTNRLFTVTGASAVSGSGDTITGSSATYSQTYNTAKQATAGNSMTLSITGLTKKVTISKLVLSMHSNANQGAGSVSVSIDGGSEDFIAGTSSTSGTGFNSFGDNTTYGSTFRDVTWDSLSYVAKSSIVIKVYCITTNSIYCESYDIFFEEEENTDVVTALSVSPNSWTGYDSGTITVSDYTVSVTKNGAAGTAADYDFQGIGSGSGDNFVARVANFTSGHPTTSDTRLQWKAKYPTQNGGSTYLYAYVALNVSADSIDTIAVSGSMPTNYAIGENWSTTGLTVTATYLSGNTDSVSSDLTWNFYSDSNLTNEIPTPEDLGIGDNQTIYVKATYTGITPNKVSPAYAQVVNVTKEPAVIHFGTASGAIQMSEGSGSGFDTLGNAVTASCNSGAYVSNSGSYVQVGSKSNPLTEWTITVNFGSGNENRFGIESFEIEFAGSGNDANATFVAYADGDENNLILSGGVSGAQLIVDTTGNDYNEINANSITVKFTGSSYGVQLHYISYVLGDKVQEFGTLSSIAISPLSTHDTIFKVGETFSTGGLVITATDTNGFTKDFTSGFTTDFDNYEFDESDVGEGIENTVSLTIGGVTKTTSYTFDVINPPTYTLISTQDDLYEGMKVLIYGATNIAMGSFNNSGYFNEAAVELTDGSITDAGDALEFTVRIYGTDGFALQHGSSYLHYSGSNNGATLSSTLNTESVWTFDSNGLVNVANTNRELRDNHGSTRFACYTNTTGSRASLYVSSATPYSELLGAETFAQKYLHLRDYDPHLHVGVDGSNYCSDNEHNYYLTAKAAYNDLSADEQTEFAKLSDAKARYEAWGRAKNDADPYDGYDDVHTPLHANVFGTISESSETTGAIITVVSLTSVAAIGGYFFLRKRRLFK